MRMRWLALVLLTPAAFAQAPSNRLSSDTKEFWTMVKTFVVRAAEKMPEENYSFRPVPEVRTFGEILNHIAGGYYATCGAERGEKRDSAVDKTKTAKADIVAVLKASVAYCDASYDALTDARGAEIISYYGQDHPRLVVLMFNIAHGYEHYGNLVTYMRIKGLVPPSSEPRM
jgi:uncharacterized damage-inducible protein DinB